MFGAEIFQFNHRTTSWQAFTLITTPRTSPTISWFEQKIPQHFSPIQWNGWPSPMPLGWYLYTVRIKALISGYQAMPWNLIALSIHAIFPRPAYPLMAYCVFTLIKTIWLHNDPTLGRSATRSVQEMSRFDRRYARSKSWDKCKMLSEHDAIAMRSCAPREVGHAIRKHQPGVFLQPTRIDSCTQFFFLTADVIGCQLPRISPTLNVSGDWR